MTTITDALSDLDQISEQAAELQRATAEHRKAAESARTEADQLVQQAAEATRLSSNQVRQRFHRIMRELSQQVSDARQAAIEAIHRGEKVADAWVCYRLTAARARGRWAALTSEYEAKTGHNAPEGPHRPELRAEPLELFVRNAMPNAERSAYEQAQREAAAELEAHRNASATTR